MPRKKLTSTQREVSRINRNLKQSIRRAKKNTNPLKIGRDFNDRPIFIHGKAAQNERVKIARANAQFEKDKATGLRPQSSGGYKLNARNLNFKSRQGYNEYMHFHNGQAQQRLLSDRANSLRKSFQTRADDLGISQDVMDDFDDKFGQMNNKELLQTINKNIANRNLTFEDVFESDQQITDNDELKQLVNMYLALGLDDKISKLDTTSINSGYVDNRNYTHFDYQQETRKLNRRDKGLV